MMILLMACLSVQCGGSLLASVRSDSLEVALTKAPETQKPAILNLLAQEYVRTNPGRADELAREALRLAREQNNRKEEAMACYFLGSSAFYANAYPKALSLFQQSIRLARQAGDERCIALNYSIIGYYYELKSQYQVAIAYYRNALAIRKRTDNKLGMGKSLDNIGNIHQYLGEYDQALARYREAFAIFEKLNDRQGLAEVSNNMGIIYYYLSDYQQAINQFQESYAIKEQLEDQKGMANSMNNIASIYQITGNHPKALKNYLKTLEIQESRGFIIPIANTSVNIGTVYAALGDYTKAEDYYNKALSLYRNLSNKKGIAVTLSNLGDVYIAAGAPEKALSAYQGALKEQELIRDKQEMAVTLRRIGDLYLSTGNPKRALEFLERSMLIASEIGSPKEILDATLSSASAYAGSGRKSLAYDFLKKAMTLKDSLLSEEKQKQISELQARFDSERKDLEISGLRQESEIQQLQLARQRYLAYSAVLVFVALLLAGLLFYTRARNRQKQKQKDLELANKDVEQRLLLTQINPHFLFNALGSVQGVIMTGTLSQASEFTGKFARLMRMNLENSRNPKISIADEIISLRYYLDIEQIRLDRKFDYDIRVADDILVNQTFLPPMLIQPLVENAILHGIRHLPGKGHIVLRFRRTNGSTIVEVEDNGVGRARSAELKSPDPHKKQSLGATLIRERLELLNLHASQHYSMQTIDLAETGSESGTRVILEIPTDME